MRRNNRHAARSNHIGGAYVFVRDISLHKIVVKYVFVLQQSNYNHALGILFEFSLAHSGLFKEIHATRVRTYAACRSAVSFAVPLK